MQKWRCNECGKEFPKPKVWKDRGECFGRTYEIKHIECPHCESGDIEEVWNNGYFFC